MQFLRFTPWICCLVLACAGCTGPQGPTGPTGERGPRGPVGPQGPPGPSSETDVAWLEHRVEGLRQEVAAMRQDGPAVTETAAEPSPEAETHGLSRVTKAQYLQLQNGMSYRSVVAIVGRDGDEMSRNKLPAVPGYPDGIETVMYMWQNPDGTSMNAMFQNDKLMQKAQWGLD